MWKLTSEVHVHVHSPGILVCVTAGMLTLKGIKVAFMVSCGSNTLVSYVRLDFSPGRFLLYDPAPATIGSRPT